MKQSRINYINQMPKHKVMLKILRLTERAKKHWRMGNYKMSDACLAKRDIYKQRLDVLRRDEPEQVLLT